MKSPLNLGLDVNTSLQTDARNYGLVNSVLTQHIGDNSSLAVIILITIIMILVVGSILILVIFRTIGEHARAISILYRGLQGRCPPVRASQP